MKQSAQESTALFDKPLWTYAEAAEALGFSPGNLRVMVHREQIPHLKLGSRVRFSPDEIAAWLRAHHRGAKRE